MSDEIPWHFVWSWIWPSLGFLVWVTGIVYLIGRFFAWFTERLKEDIRVEAHIDPIMLEHLERLTIFGALVAGVYGWVSTAPMPEAVHEFMRDSVQPWFWYTLGLIGWIVGGTYVTRRVVVFLADRARRTNAVVDDALAHAIRRPIYGVILLIGVNLWAVSVGLPWNVYAYLQLANKAVTILVIVIFLDGFIHNWVELRAADSQVFATSGAVLSTAAKIVVYALGVLIVLSTVNIDITPLIASLGIGSLAIGLALQKTLEDFLAGLLIAADQPIRVGDFVEVESEVSGYVLSIGWRTTRIRTRDDMYLIVPNGKLAQATLVNRSMPTAEVGFTLAVGIAYESDLDNAAAVSLQVIHRIQQEHASAVHSFEPRLGYESFGDSDIVLRMWLRARSWEEHFLLKDAAIRAIQQRFKEEGISIPFPMRTIEIRSTVETPAQLSSDVGDAAQVTLEERST